MNRADYLALFARIDATGTDSRVHWASGTRAGASQPWNPTDVAPGRPVVGLGESCREVDGELAFVETLKGTPQLIVAGAGHVGVAVAQLGVMLGFQVTVVDERPEFARPDRLPGVAEVLCGDYGTVLAGLPEHGNAYYVLVTPGHRMDREAASACLRRRSEYVGMIGSRGKIATVRSALASEGIDPDALARLRAPIGLDLGGREPAEIAVAIAAEIIQVRAERGARSFDPRVREAIEGLDAPLDLSPLNLSPQDTDPLRAQLHRNPPGSALRPARQQGRPAVLATIIGQGGSAPRGAGSRMLVDASGPVAGSVGGGPVEAAAIVHALSLLTMDAPAIDVQDYELSNAQAAPLGMICGGRVRILFERL